MRREFVVQQKSLTYLVFLLVVRHHLNSCDKSNSACDKVRLIRLRHQNHVLYHNLSIAGTGTFQYIHSEDTSYMYVIMIVIITKYLDRDQVSLVLIASVLSKRTKLALRLIRRKVHQLS